MIKKLFYNKTDNTLIQLFRYTFVGGTAFLIDYSSLYIFTEFVGIHYLISAIFAFTLGLITNYILSILWVFKTRKVANKSVEFTIFALIGIIGLAVNELIIWFFTDIVSFHYMISKIISTGIVYFWNFLARKYFLYSK